ncbi:hypothetical protein M426DRAFT_320786 [Hypoxylon sp. CI-4A]|nr:hypothetical protein M426DRAFT_320786 [Hypoxylon sp. CI-4A]
MADRQRNQKQSEKKKKQGNDSDNPPAYKPDRLQPRSSPESPPSYEEATSQSSVDSDEYDKVTDEDLEDAKFGLPERYYDDDSDDAKRRASGAPPSFCCRHWDATRCTISSGSRRCCACLDTRPRTTNGLYPMFVSGKGGWTQGATRWQYYCANCREYYDPDSQARIARDRRAWAERRARSLADERNQRFFGLGRWVPTLQELKAFLPG